MADYSYPQVSDEAYDEATWNGVDMLAPSKNAVRDLIESLGGGAVACSDEGISLTSTLTSLNFVGGGVTATNVGDAVTVTIPADAVTSVNTQTGIVSLNTSHIPESGNLYHTIARAQDAVDDESLTFSNKGLLTGSVLFKDTSDPTKDLVFDVDGLGAGGSWHIEWGGTAATGDVVTTLLPGTMVTDSGSATLSNKFLDATTTFIRNDFAGNVQDFYVIPAGSGDGTLGLFIDPVGDDLVSFPACDACTVAYTETTYYQTVRDEGTARTQRPSLNFTGAGVSCVDNAGSSRTDCTIAGGSGAPRTHITLATSVLPNVLAAGAAPADNCTLALTNLNTTMRQVGTQVNVKMDDFGNARGIFRLKNAGGQSGQISCQIRNLTDSTTLIASTDVTTSTTCTTAEGTATPALTGVKQFACECSNSTGTNDPLLAYCGLELSP
jgi:hypothetical protein